MVNAPGHGKDEVDGLNATTERFLKQKTRTRRNKMNGSMGHGRWRLASEAKRLL
jgi:hypothetical protein